MINRNRIAEAILKKAVLGEDSFFGEIFWSAMFDSGKGSSMFGF